MMEDEGKASFIKQRNPEMLFKILDKDNDDKISLEEAENAPKGKLAENFSFFDNNEDRFIDKEEIIHSSKNRK